MLKVLWHYCHVVKSLIIIGDCLNMQERMNRSKVLPHRGEASGRPGRTVGAPRSIMVLNTEED